MLAVRLNNKLLLPCSEVSIDPSLRIYFSKNPWCCINISTSIWERLWTLTPKYLLNSIIFNNWDNCCTMVWLLFENSINILVPMSSFLLNLCLMGEISFQWFKLLNIQTQSVLLTRNVNVLVSLCIIILIHPVYYSSCTNNYFGCWISFILAGGRVHWFSSLVWLKHLNFVHLTHLSLFAKYLWRFYAWPTETIAVELQLVNLLDVNITLSGVSLIWNMEQKLDKHKVTTDVNLCDEIVLYVGASCILWGDQRISITSFRT